MQRGSQVSELDNQVKKTIKITLIILAGVLVALAFFPQEGVVWGLAIGVVTGIYNSVTLARRVKRLPDLSPKAAKSFLKKGIFIRLGMIMAVLFFLTQKMPFVNLLGVGAGILVPSYVSVAFSVLDSFKLSRQTSI